MLYVCHPYHARSPARILPSLVPETLFHTMFSIGRLRDPSPGSGYSRASRSVSHSPSNRAATLCGQRCVLQEDTHVSFHPPHGSTSNSSCSSPAPTHSRSRSCPNLYNSSGFQTKKESGKASPRSKSVQKRPMQFVWPKDKHRSSGGRLKDILTGKGSDIYINRQGDPGPHRSTQRQLYRHETTSSPRQCDCITCSSVSKKVESLEERLGETPPKKCAKERHEVRDFHSRRYISKEEAFWSESR